MARINLNKLDPQFKHRVADQPGGEGLKACFLCKACTAACPIQPLDKRYDPRKIIRMVLLGMKDEVLKSDFIWLCSSCYGCQEVCPQNVRFTEVMYAIKNLAAQEACMPPGLTAQRSLLRKHGRLYEVGEFENDKRFKLGLPPIVEHPEDYEKLLPDRPTGV
ncbi:MAG: 4Fe-4S dicluster domain-containing protein [Deltaproteobacteria bacterium]|nr:4Fe-4S dicluster domain-containing protein [Deltaproteobacteria bacterium]